MIESEGNIKKKVKGTFSLFIFLFLVSIKVRGKKHEGNNNEIK